MRKNMEKLPQEEIRFSRAFGKAIGETRKRQAQPKSEYEHAKHQDIRFGLTTWEDFFDRKPY